jgi:hypothetical protein
VIQADILPWQAHTQTLVLSLFLLLQGASGERKNAFVAPFYTEHDHFTKTGSGQT